MKKWLLCLAVVLFPALSWAAPFLVSDSCVDTETMLAPTQYVIQKQTGTDASGAPIWGPDLVIPAEVLPDKSVCLHYDLAAYSVAQHNLRVKAQRTDPMWGALESAWVPFGFTKPGLKAITGIGLSLK